MNADEMFEELGYEKVKEPVFEDWIVYRKDNPNDDIIFYPPFKNVYVNSTINAKLHMTIGQKMKELGWLDE